MYKANKKPATEAGLRFMVALTGGSSNFADRVRRLASELPALLQRRLRPSKVRKRQMQRRLSPQEVKRLVAQYKAGDNMQQLAKHWYLHRTTVADHLRRAGIPVRQRGIPIERLDEAIRLYAGGWSCQRLADRYRCDDETVRQTLKRSGIKMRHHRSEGQTPL